LASEQKAVEAEKRATAAEAETLRAQLDAIAAERTAVVAALPAALVSTFELVASRRNGIAISEARAGICTICHVRLRPQVFNTLLKNEQILQCDHCNRILYYVPPAPAAVSESTGSSAS